VLPAIEALQTAWEAKRKGPHFAIYYDVINKGLAKLQKYYSQFDKKPSYVLALGKLPLNLSPSSLLCVKFTALHPYYKLEFIKMAWGGLEEQAEEIEAGNVKQRTGKMRHRRYWRLQ